MHLRFTTAGESHGKAFVAVVEGLPAGLPVTAEAVDRDLGRRMQGYGRGARMKIERDCIELARRGTRRRDARLARRDADRQSRLGQLGGHHGARGGRRRESCAAGASPDPGPATPTLPACSSTTVSTRATSWSGRARARPRRASRRARWPGGSSTSSGWRWEATWCALGGVDAPRPAELPVPLNEAADRSEVRVLDRRVERGDRAPHRRGEEGGRYPRRRGAKWWPAASWSAWAVT